MQIAEMPSLAKNRVYFLLQNINLIHELYFLLGVRVGKMQNLTNWHLCHFEVAIESHLLTL
jgi:hypothetical protein